MFLLPKVVIDWLFPVDCLGCQASDVWLCSSCLAAIKLYTNQPALGQTVQVDQLNRLLIAADYQQPLLQTAIQCYKYRFVEDLAEPLGQLLVAFLQQQSHLKVDVVLPIPLAAQRWRWRGFNQSEGLARSVGVAFSWPVDTTSLARQRFTRPQVGLTQRERQRNLAGAFRVVRPEAVQGRHILLVDDVVTTGTTLNECAGALRQAGAGQVSALVLAHG